MNKRALEAHKRQAAVKLALEKGKSYAARMYGVSLSSFEASAFTILCDYIGQRHDGGHCADRWPPDQRNSQITEALTQPSAKTPHKKFCRGI